MPPEGLVLASASPRRRELLESLRVSFAVVPADIDEAVRDGEEPRRYVARLSAEKAAAVAESVSVDAVIVAADTTVDVGGRILGKPVDGAEARSMLASLSGRTHQVHTGVTVRCGERVLTAVASTAVAFAHLTDEIVEWYLSTEEPFDKAGAYAIQGAGALLVERVDGSVSNVIGLPLTLLADLLAQLGVTLVDPPPR